MKVGNVFTTATRFNMPEDRFTASLVFVLEYLWKEADSESRRRACAEFLTHLCGLEFDPDAEPGFIVHPTLRSGSKIVRPDFEIVSADTVIWVEVKDTAPLKPGKISEYMSALQKKAEAIGKDCRCSVVLLRHFYVDPEIRKGAADVQWSLLYRLLVRLKNRISEHYAKEGGIGCWLLGQFVSYLENKGVVSVNRVEEEQVENGFLHLMSLFALIQDAAKRLFQDRGINVRVSKTCCSSDLICFYLDKVKRGNPQERGYAIEISADDPTIITMSTKRENIGVVEGRRVIEDRLEQRKAESVFVEEDGWIYHRGISLKAVLQKITVEEQSDALYRVLHEMLRDFDYIKNQRPGPKSRRVDV